MSRGGVENTRLEAKAKDSTSEDRPSLGYGQECSRSRPRTKDTGLHVLQKKKIFEKNFFRRSPKDKKRSSQIFHEVCGVFQQNFKDSKNSAVLEPRTGLFEDMRLWGQGLDLRAQGQRLQNVSSRNPSWVWGANSLWEHKVKFLTKWLEIYSLFSKIGSHFNAFY